MSLQDDQVSASWLVEMEFASGTQRAWEGTFDLTTADGRVWKPLPFFGRITPIKDQSATVADSFQLAVLNPFDVDDPDGQAEFAAAVREAFAEDTSGRWATVYLQEFELGTTTKVGLPVAVTTGEMGPVVVEGAPQVTSVRVSVSGLLSDASAPPHGLATDADHQARWPGDDICKYLPALPDRELTWP